MTRTGHFECCLPNGPVEHRGRLCYCFLMKVVVVGSWQEEKRRLLLGRNNAPKERKRKVGLESKNKSKRREREKESCNCCLPKSTAFFSSPHGCKFGFSKRSRTTFITCPPHPMCLPSCCSFTWHKKEWHFCWTESKRYGTSCVSGKSSFRK